MQTVSAFYKMLISSISNILPKLWTRLQTSQLANEALEVGMRENQSVRMQNLQVLCQAKEQLHQALEECPPRRRRHHKFIFLR